MLHQGPTAERSECWTIIQCGTKVQTLLPATQCFGSWVNNVGSLFTRWCPFLSEQRQHNNVPSMGYLHLYVKLDKLVMDSLTELETCSLYSQCQKYQKCEFISRNHKTDVETIERWMPGQHSERVDVIGISMTSDLRYRSWQTGDNLWAGPVAETCGTCHSNYAVI